VRHTPENADASFVDGRQTGSNPSAKLVGVFSVGEKFPLHSLIKIGQFSMSVIACSRHLTCSCGCSSTEMAFGELAVPKEIKSYLRWIVNRPEQVPGSQWHPEGRTRCRFDLDP
jgi:hypothetical protein